MNEKDKLEFAMLMQGLAEVFSPDKPLTEAFVVIYYEALKGFKIKDIRQAVNKVMVERVFNGMPKPAEIVNKIRGEESDRATLAWNKLTKAIRRVGPYSSVMFDDPVIHACIEALGGWPKVCFVLEDELQWLQRDFIAQYKVMQGRPCRLKHNAGITEQINAANGFEQYDVAFVGDEQVKRKQIANDKDKVSNDKEEAAGEQSAPVRK